MSDDQTEPVEPQPSETPKPLGMFEEPILEGGKLATMELGDETASDADKEAHEEEEEKKPGLFDFLGESSPYTFLLLVAVLALAIGTACLWIEWGRYNFDTKAKGARQLGAACQFYPTASSTTAAA